MLNIKNIDKISKIVNLKLNNKEKNNILNNLFNILFLIKKIKNINLKKIKPLYHPISIINPKLSIKLSHDKIDKKIIYKKIYNKKKNFYFVPKIIK